jgi:hypothetical protein
MLGRSPYNPTPYDDDWEDQPRQSFFHMWVLGLMVPMGIAYYSVGAVIARHATFTGRGATMLLEGREAIALGIAWTSAAVFLHCHYFWGNVYNQAWGAVLGKIFGAAGFIAGMGFLIIRVGLLGKG